MKTRSHLLALAALAVTACVPAPVVEETKEAGNIDVIRTFFDANNAFVFTRDLNNTTGAGAIVNLNTLKVLDSGIGQGTYLSEDAVLQSDSRYIYIIDRTNATVTVVDPLEPSKELKQFSTGAGTNPQSVVRINDKLYITRFNDPAMLVLDAKTYAEITTITFDDYVSEFDVLPEMDRAVTAESKVWVALDRIDESWSPSTSPTDGSFLVSIDPKTDAIVDSVKLLGTNPYQVLKVDPLTQNLYTVSSVPNGYSTANGIEMVDPKTAASTGWLVEPNTFPEGIFFAEATTTHVYIVSGEGFQGFDIYDWDASILWAIDRKTDEKVEVARSLAGYYGFGCLELSPKNLLVTCAGPSIRVTTPGLRVFDTHTLKELTKAPLDTGLPPMGIAFFSRPETEVVQQPATAATE